MKLTYISIAAFTTMLATACNNESANTSNSTDTPAKSTETAQPATDTMQPTGDLMKPMSDMMGKMDEMKMSGDFDIDFANMMIEHHQSGIDMAKVEQTAGKNEALKTKAQEIIGKQQKEQQDLRDFVKTYKPSGMKHGEGELQKSMSEMKSKMQSMKMSGNVDKDFATMMISHHEDGIKMAKMQLQHGMSPDLKQMAKKGIEEQQKDIKDLKTNLSKL